MSAPFYAVFGMFIALGVIAIVCTRYTNRHRPMASNKPWEDPRCSLRMHRKIVSRQ